MTTTQNFLQDGNTIEKLVDTYFLKFRRHKKYNNLILFKYNQTKSPFDEIIVREARGIILDEDDNWKIISWPYYKFFNYGEPNSLETIKNLDLKSVKIYEKLDGSLMTLYYYNNKWHVSTSGTPDASGKCTSELFENGTFKKLFWQTWKKLNYNLPDESDNNKNYIFELLTPFNQIIVPQKESRIVLHGVRSRDSLLEEDPSAHSKKYSWELVKIHNITEVNVALDLSKTLDPSISEGYVICDKYFNRLKIKGQLYVHMSHIGTNNKCNDVGLLKLIQTSESAEFLSYFPEYNDLYVQLTKIYDDLVDKISNSIKEYENITDQKTFAFSIKDIWYKPCLFGIRNKKFNSIREWLSKYDTEKLLIYLTK